MTANPVLLQLRYSRIVERYAKAVGVSLRDTLGVFIVPMYILL